MGIESIERSLWPKYPIIDMAVIEITLNGDRVQVLLPDYLQDHLSARIVLLL